MTVGQIAIEKKCWSNK